MKCRNPIVIHYVHDMNRARAFYVSVFEVEPLFESPGWTTLDFGAIELALHILHPNSREVEAPLPHAGLMDDPLNTQIVQHIFWGSRADWDVEAEAAQYHHEYPLS